MSSDDNDQDAQTDDAYDRADGPDGDETAYVGGEPKKPMGKGTVAMFALLAVAGAGTYAMYARTGPQSASAATDPRAQQVINQYMTDRTSNVTAMQKMLRDTEAVVKQFLDYPSVKQIPLNALAANPFRLADASTESVAKIDDQREKKRREEERVAVLKSVNALQLQSVMHGEARRSCMVNNVLYTEGQQVDGFTVEKISPNSVVVRNGSYRFELRMQR